MRVCKLPPLESHSDSWHEWQFTCQCQQGVAAAFDNSSKSMLHKTNDLQFVLGRRFPSFPFVSRKRENECPFVPNRCPMSRLILFSASLSATSTLAIGLQSESSE